MIQKPPIGYGATDLSIRHLRGRQRQRARGEVEEAGVNGPILYLVGLTMLSPTHDYSKVHAALKHLKGRKTSDRIWLCEVDESKSVTIFALLRQCLAEEYRILVERAPPHMHFGLPSDNSA